jgi:hypothetical protein
MQCDGPRRYVDGGLPHDARFVRIVPMLSAMQAPFSQDPHDYSPVS